MNNNQIVLVNSNQMKPVVAPLALDYLAQALTTAGFEVDILDLAFDNEYKDMVSDYFAQNAPLAIGITIRNTDDCYFASQDFVLRRTKQIEVLSIISGISPKAAWRSLRRNAVAINAPMG